MIARGLPPLIAHVIFRLDFGGLENGLVNLVNRMPAQRYRHVILCLAGVGAEFRRRIARADVEVVSLDKRPGKDIGAYARMWRQLRRLRPAVVHTRNLGTIDMQWVAAAVGVNHRVHGEHGWEASDPLGRNPRSQRIRRACRPVIDRYVPMSRDIGRWLERDVGVAPGRIRQIYSGVDTEKFRPAGTVSGSSWPKRPGEDALVIGTVGRLNPVKNQAALLRAVRSILDRAPEFADRLRLTVVGEGALRTELECLARGLGLSDRVLFAGARSDTPDLFRAMDLFALPSLNEGISNTILEAMATGLPVVAAKVGGNPELVAEGVTGALYDSDEPGGLETALFRYLTNPGLRGSHGAAGRKRVVQDFSLDTMVRRYLDLYDELLIHSRTAGGRGVD